MSEYCKGGKHPSVASHHCRRSRGMHSSKAIKNGVQNQAPHSADAASNTEAKTHPRPAAQIDNALASNHRWTMLLHVLDQHHGGWPYRRTCSIRALDLAALHLLHRELRRPHFDWIELGLRMSIPPSQRLRSPLQRFALPSAALGRIQRIKESFRRWVRHLRRGFRRRFRCHSSRVLSCSAWMVVLRKAICVALCNYRQQRSMELHRAYCR